jgi:hypothetical protein
MYILNLVLQRTSIEMQWFSNQTMTINNRVHSLLHRLSQYRLCFFSPCDFLYDQYPKTYSSQDEHNLLA